jgi:hypothetical protein
MVGATGKDILSSRGVKKWSEMTAPPGGNAADLDRFWQNMEGTSAPFPEEPVGVGARWEVRQQVVSQGISMEQTTYYTLVSRKGNKAVVSLAIAQAAAPQNLSLPDLPPGSSARLESFSGSGSGSQTINLQNPMGTSAQLDYNLDFRMGMGAPGETSSIGVQLKMGLVMAGK